MKTKSVIAILLISMLMVQDGESWFIDLRRVVDAVVKPICNWACPRVCTWVLDNGSEKYVCNFVCNTVCGKKKREAVENSHVTPLPYYMNFYDIDDNDLLSLKEIAVTLGHFEMESDLVKAFNMTDIDQDGMLTEEEFFLSTCFVFHIPDAEPTPSQ